MLLVLDNCEHVVDAAAAAVEELTEACRELRVLATSREALAIDGEFVIPVRPLDPTTRRSSCSSYEREASGAPVSASQRTVARQICRRLDGLPLAIELAADEVHPGTPCDRRCTRRPLLAALRWSSPWCRPPSDDARRRVEWSYQLLSPERSASSNGSRCFPAGFELDAVRHVAAVHGLAPSDAPDLIATLVRKSTVEADLDAPTVRYRLLETVRAFAIEARDRVARPNVRPRRRPSGWRP